MSKKVFLQSILTLLLFSVGLLLFSYGNTLLVELGKGVIFLSAISLGPLAQSVARVQIQPSRYESTRIHYHLEASELQKKEVA